MLLHDDDVLQRNISLFCHVNWITWLTWLFIFCSPLQFMCVFPFMAAVNCLLLERIQRRSRNHRKSFLSKNANWKIGSHENIHSLKKKSCLTCLLLIKYLENLSGRGHQDINCFVNDQPSTASIYKYSLRKTHTNYFLLVSSVLFFFWL